MKQIIVTILSLMLVACSGSVSSGGAGLPPTRIPAKRLTLNSLGDSVTAGYLASTSYPFIIGKQMGYFVANLGIGSETAVEAVTSELPHVYTPCVDATVYLGINDGAKIGEGLETLAQYTSAMQIILATLKRECSRVFVSTVIDNHYRQPENLVNPIIRSLGYPVIDLTTDPRMRNPAYFNSDFLHPNDAGQAAIAQDFETILQAH